jgi:hypothetical protein
MKSVDSEKLVERKLVELIKLNGGMCIKLLCNHILGLPDRLCLFPGAKIAFVELKTTGEKPKKIQLYMHTKLRKLGFEVFVIDSVQGVKDFVEFMVLYHYAK